MWIDWNLHNNEFHVVIWNLHIASVSIAIKFSSFMWAGGLWTITSSNPSLDEGKGGDTKCSPHYQRVQWMKFPDQSSRAVTVRSAICIRKSISKCLRNLIESPSYNLTICVQIRDGKVLCTVQLNWTSQGFFFHINKGKVTSDRN